MKRLGRAINAFYRVLMADQYFIVTTDKKEFHYLADIKLDVFSHIAKDVIDDCIGENKVLDMAKEIINKTP